LRSDLERKRLCGVEETSRLAPEAYTKAANDEVYAILRNKARHVLAAGHAAVVDAVFSKPEERSGIEAVAAELGVPFRGLWLEAPPGKLLDRVAARIGDASDATPDVVRRQLEGDAGPLTASWGSVDAGGNAASTLAQAREVLAAMKVPPP
jgi:predicted kinase